MKNKYKFFLLCLFLVQCSAPEDNSEFRVGFSKSNSGKATPWLYTAVSGQRIQNDEIYLSVFAGYHSGFFENFESSETEKYDFVLVREFWTLDWKESDKKVLDVDLSDFNNEEKYLINYSKNDDKSETLLYRFNFVDNFSFEKIPFDAGIIAYEFFLIDESKELNEDVLLEYGMSISYIFFKKDVSLVTFSEDKDF